MCIKAVYNNWMRALLSSPCQLGLGVELSHCGYILTMPVYWDRASKHSIHCLTHLIRAQGGTLEVEDRKVTTHFILVW